MNELWLPNRVRDEMASHKKGKKPPLGPAFAHKTFDLAAMSAPGAATLMFNLEKLTLADFRAMRYHPQINASIMLMTFMIHQQEWKIVCKENQAIGDVVEENMRLIWSRLVRAISTAWWAGRSPNALEWDNTTDGKHVFISKIKDLQPEECEVNWLMEESSYVPPPQYTGGPTPQRTKIPVYDGIKKLGLNYPIPAELTFWYPTFMENGDYTGRKLLASAFTPWYFSVLIHLYSNRYFERFGEPIPVGRAPFDDDFTYFDRAANKNVTKSGKQVMEDMLLNLRNRGVVVLPSDRDPTASSSGGRSEYTYDIEYLESQMRGADFERYMMRLDEEIALSLFTPMLLMRSGDTGSNALGVQHTETWLWSLNAITGDMKEYIDRYIVQRIANVNFYGERTPKCEWVPRPMGKDNPETIKAIITSLIGGGLAMPDLEEFAIKLGMSLHEIEQVDPNNADGSTKKPDQRNRSTRDRSKATGTPKNIAEPLSTGRSIAARVAGQVTKAWGKEFGAATFSLGFHRRFIESLEAEGWDVEQAGPATDELFSRMDAWMKTAQTYADEFSGPQDFMALFERRLNTEIMALAG